MKLIIFGAAKLIYKSAKEAINSQTMKIVAFSDNDERKTGKHGGGGELRGGGGSYNFA